MSRKVVEPYITVTRKKRLETLFKQPRPEKEKPDDSEKRVVSTTLRKRKESEVPVEVVSKLHPNLSAKNLTIPLQPVSLQSCNQSSKVEKNKTTDTEEKALNTLRKNGGTEPGISTKSAQYQSSKVENKKSIDTEYKAPNPLRKDGGTESGISTKLAQNQSIKIEKNRTTDTEEKAPNPLRKDGSRNLGSQQISAKPIYQS